MKYDIKSTYESELRKVFAANDSREIILIENKDSMKVENGDRLDTRDIWAPHQLTKNNLVWGYNTTICINGICNYETPNI